MFQLMPGVTVLMLMGVDDENQILNIASKGDCVASADPLQSRSVALNTRQRVGDHTRAGTPGRRQSLVEGGAQRQAAAGAWMFPPQHGRHPKCDYVRTESVVVYQQGATLPLATRRSSAFRRPRTQHWIAGHLGGSIDSTHQKYRATASSVRQQGSNHISWGAVTAQESATSNFRSYSPL